MQDAQKSFKYKLVVLTRKSTNFMVCLASKRSKNCKKKSKICLMNKSKWHSGNTI